MKNKRVLVISFIIVIALAIIMVGQGQKVFAQALEHNFKDVKTEVLEVDKDDIENDSIIITLTRDETTKFSTYTPKDFSEVDCTSVEDLTQLTVDYARKKTRGEYIEKSMLVNIESFKRILKLEFKEKHPDDIYRVIKILEKRADILFAEPNYIYSISVTPNDTHYGHNDQWGLNGTNGINAPVTWDISTGASSVTVGVLDTGIQANHSDLSNRVSTAGLHRDCTVYPIIPVANSNLFDPNGHGTHVAGIIGAQGNNGAGVSGVAWDVRLASLRVMDEKGEGNTGNITRAINFAAANNIQILNFSGVGPVNDLNMQDAVAGYDGLFVVAAGNGGNDYIGDNNDIIRQYPSDYSRGQTFSNRVISVGAMDNAGNPASFSNFGANSVSLFAPGVNILSTFPQTRCQAGTVTLNINGTSTECRRCEWEETEDGLWYRNGSTHHANGYHYMDGTSMATPFVSGVAALMLSANPNLTPAQIKQMIIDTAEPVAALNNLCVARGRLNAYEAVKRAAFSTTPIAGTNNVRIDSLSNNLKQTITGKLDIPSTIRFRENGNIINRTVTEIGSSAFANSNCNEITIPASVTSIGQSAFAGTALNTLNMLSANPPTLGSNVFNTVPISIYVPNWNSLASYNASSNWHNYVIMGNVRVNASSEAPVGFLDVSTPTRLAGWIYNSRVPQMSIAVHVLVYNAVTNAYLTTWVIEANQYRPDVQAAGYGTGMYGFDFTIPTTYNYGIKMNLHAITGTGYHPIFGSGKKNTTDVTFDKQGGSGGTNSTLAGLNLSMPSATAPTRPGYTFGGYWTGTGGTGTQYYNANMGGVRNWNITSGATTLYAKWTYTLITKAVYYHTEMGPYGPLGSWYVDLQGISTITVTYGVSQSIQSPNIDKYTFAHWSSGINDDYNNTEQILHQNATFNTTDYQIATNGQLTIYAVYTKNSCVAEGTMVTIANGSQVAVEDLTGEEMLLVWNLFTGTFDVAPILFIDSDPYNEYEIIHLYFSDGTEVKVISEHGFWDIDLNEYVFLRNDAEQYIGHWFNKQTEDSNGNMVWTAVQLVDVGIYTEYTTSWSPVTFGHLCYYVNGMLSMPGATEGLINIFEVNAATMQYDATYFATDITTYGLFTYEEFAEIIQIPEIIFEAFNGQYLKVSIGKGLITMDGLIALIERYADFFPTEDTDTNGNGNQNGQGRGNHHGHNNGNGNHNGHRRRGR